MNVDAIRFLTDALESGLLEDVSEQRLRENLCTRPDSWYAKEARQNGQDSAERAFEDWWLRRECSIYGAAVEPIVDAMLRIAKKDNENIITSFLSPDRNDQYFPFGHSHTGRQTAVMITNPEHKGDIHTVPEDSTVWSVSGSLGLLAVSLLKLERSHSISYTIHLSFKLHRAYQNIATGYTSLEFGTDGNIDQRSHLFIPREDPYLFLQQIGIPDENTRLITESIGGHLIPRESECFISHLPQLPVYLSEMAGLMTDHEHG